MPGPCSPTHQRCRVPSANWCGALGYYIAHYLFSFLGLAAFLPVLILGYTSVAALVPGSSLNSPAFVVAGISGILLASSGLLATARQLLFPPDLLSPGGYLGVSGLAPVRPDPGARGFASCSCCSSSPVP